jgi:hypothetical protein
MAGLHQWVMHPCSNTPSGQCAVHHSLCTIRRATHSTDHSCVAAAHQLLKHTPCLLPHRPLLAGAAPRQPLLQPGRLHRALQQAPHSARAAPNSGLQVGAGKAAAGAATQHAGPPCSAPARGRPRCLGHRPRLDCAGPRPVRLASGEPLRHRTGMGRRSPARLVRQGQRSLQEQRARGAGCAARGGQGYGGPTCVQLGERPHGGRRACCAVRGCGVALCQLV